MSRDVQDRIGRALHQRLFLLQAHNPTSSHQIPTHQVPTHQVPTHQSYQVAGLQGQYTVRLDTRARPQHTCTCPDFTRRLQLCKHAYFILFRVLRLDIAFWEAHSELPLAEQQPSTRPLPETEQARPTMPRQTLPGPPKRRKTIVHIRPTMEAFSHTHQCSFHTQEDCAICYEPLPSETPIPVVPCLTCHHLFHEVCMQTWVKFSSHRNCPLCRTVMQGATVCMLTPGAAAKAVESVLEAEKAVGAGGATDGCMTNGGAADDATPKRKRVADVPLSLSSLPTHEEDGGP
jgi:hypothetical protein